ncbi:MAG: tail fiber protein [Bacteroidales bacterium]|nr:tail fiber protein [Bacteroidales bacterium]
MKKTTIILFILIIALTSIKAQVGINNANPDSTAILDLKSTSKGLLVPRMTSSERSIMSSFGNVPANSLLVFDTELEKFCFWNDSQNQWEVINSWKSSTEAGADVYINDTICIGVGTNDAQAQLDLAGASNKGSNRAGTKLMIRNYDNDGSVIYIIKAEDENGDVDFYIRNKQNSSGQAKMHLAGTFGIGTENPSEQLEVVGNVKAHHFIGNGTIPVGGIIMWSGSTIPSGWALCNGQSVNGHITPNLIDRFIVGSGGSYSVGSTGGASSVALNINQMPSHNHGVTDPGHTHSFWTAANYVNDLETDPSTNTDHVRQNHIDVNTGNSTTNITIQHTGGNQAHENRPPYYALAYIMRIQ